MKYKKLMAVLMIIMGIIVTAENNKLTVYYFDRMPYYGSENGRMTGIMVEISNLIFDEAGIKYAYEEMPTKRILDNLRNPENTASLGWFRTNEREGLYTFTDEPIYQDEPYSIIINKAKAGEFQKKTVKDILTNKKSLAVVDGFIYGEWLDGNIAKYTPVMQKINIGNDSEKLYKMLVEKRFDYMFAGFEESSYVINNNSVYKKELSIIRVTDAPAGNARYIMFSKGIDKPMFEKINSAVTKVKQSDKYKKILAKIRNDG